MKLIKTVFFSGIITCVRVISGFVGGKALAIFTGPSGVAIVGAFTNCITILLTFANGAINIGVVKYTAEYDNDKQKLKSLFSTAFKISVVCSTFFGTALFFLSPLISTWIFASLIYVNVFRVLGITIILYSLNTLFISILNGKREVKKYTIVNTSGSILGLFLTIFLVYFYKVEGALYALVLVQSVVFFLTAALVCKSEWFSWDFFKQSYDIVIAKKLSAYSIMAIASALTVPVSQIVLRNMLISKIDISAAGYWQGMMRISDGYLFLATTSLSTYFLPKLSSINKKPELRKEIIQGFKIILPTVFLGCVAIFFLRFFIIRILYTPKFLIMEQLFFWQLIGDFFKIATFILGYLLLAKAMTKTFILIEVGFGISYIILGYFFVDNYHFRGITMAFALNYMLCLIVMVYVFRSLLFNTRSNIHGL